MSWIDNRNKKAYLAIIGALFLLLLIGANSYFRNLSEKYWEEIPKPEFIAGALNYALDLRQIPVVELSNITEREYGEAEYIWDGIGYSITFNEAVVEDLQFSPDKRKVTFFYPIDREFSSDKYVLIVYDLAKSEVKELFTGRSPNELSWLDESHVVFKVYCGTSCAGFNLVNTETGEIKEGVITYLFSEDRNIWYTYFKDGYGREFEFDGFGSDITTETIDNKNYLVFNLTDDENNYIGQKKFLFTGDKLIE